MDTVGRKRPGGKYQGNDETDTGRAIQTGRMGIHENYVGIKK